MIIQAIALITCKGLGLTWSNLLQYTEKLEHPELNFLVLLTTEVLSQTAFLVKYVSGFMFQ